MNAAMQRLLVAVDDSAAALRAVDVAVRLAATTGAEVRFVHVTGDGVLRRALATAGDGGLPDRVGRGVGALMDHVSSHARQAGVPCSVVSLSGEPEAEVVAEARAWGADLVVIGRSQSGAVGQPYVGHVTRHILEFSDAPVLVVPRPRAAVSGRSRHGSVSPEKPEA